jgi:uncharacterized membrane protein SirB2
MGCAHAGGSVTGRLESARSLKWRIQTRRKIVVIEFYPQIKLVHVAAVLASGGLFTLRALAVLLGQRWAMVAPLRYLSYSIDTVLLTAALMLMTVLHQFPIVNSWLTVKVFLVIVYIILGSFALKRARSRRARLGFTVAALAIFAIVVSVARTHGTLGPIVWLEG